MPKKDIVPIFLLLSWFFRPSILLNREGLGFLGIIYARFFTWVAPGFWIFTLFGETSTLGSNIRTPSEAKWAGLQRREFSFHCYFHVFLSSFWLPCSWTKTLQQTVWFNCSPKKEVRFRDWGTLRKTCPSWQRNYWRSIWGAIKSLRMEF